MKNQPTCPRQSTRQCSDARFRILSAAPPVGSLSIPLDQRRTGSASRQSVGIPPARSFAYEALSCSNLQEYPYRLPVQRFLLAIALPVPRTELKTPRGSPDSSIHRGHSGDHITPDCRPHNECNAIDHFGPHDCSGQMSSPPHHPNQLPDHAAAKSDFGPPHETVPVSPPVHTALDRST